MRCLAVHGYEIKPGGKLGLLAQSVCQQAARIAHEYDVLLLLAGWHRRDVCPRPTIAEVMAADLVRRGVPREKVHTQFSLGCQHLLPTRDTMEEVDHLPSLLRALQLDPLRVSFDALCVWYFIPRVQFLYQSRGAHCRRVHGAWSLKTLLQPKRIYFQFMAYAQTRRDPYGESEQTQRHRVGRTMTYEYPGGPVSNVPSAWQQHVTV